jgi:hypothetical protein
MNVARDAFRGIVRHRDGKPDELIKFIEANEPAVRHVINFLEEMATCCRHDLVDVPLMKSQFDAVITSTWDTLFPWVRKVRDEAKSNIWEDVEFLYYKWKQP